MRFVKLGENVVNPALVTGLAVATIQVEKDEEPRIGIGILTVGAARPFFVEGMTMDEVITALEGGLDAS